MKTLFFIFFAVLTFSANAKLSVSNGGKGLFGDLDRNGQPMQITIFYAKNKQELDQKVKEMKGYSMDDGQSGIAFYSKSDNICQVFVIQPKRDSAVEMAKLGHEVYHCTNGAFH